MTTNQIEKNRDDRNGPRCSNRSNENSCSNSADIDYHYNKDDRLNFDPQPTFSKTPLATNKANTNCIRRKSEAQPNMIAGGGGEHQYQDDRKPYYFNDVSNPKTRQTNFDNGNQNDDKNDNKKAN